MRLGRDSLRLLCLFVMIWLHFPNKGLAEIQKPLKLIGPWDFYWNKRLEPKDALPTPDLRLELRQWNGLTLPSGQVLESFGLASYVMETPDLEKDRSYTFYLRSIASSAKVYIFHPDFPEYAQFHEIGRVDAVQSQGTKRSIVMNFRPLHQGAHRIIMQVANHSNHKGGFWLPPVLGPSAAIKTAIMLNDLANLLAIGIAIHVAAYSLLSWSKMPNDKSALFLFFIATGSTLRIIGTSAFFAEVLPDTAETFLRRLEYLSIPWGVCYLLFLRSNFSMTRTLHRGVYAITSYCFGLIAFTLLAPSHVFSRFLFLYQFAILLVAIWCLIIISRVFFKRQRGAQLLFFGSLLLAMTVANDIFLVNILQVHGVFTVSLGAAVFLILHLQLVTQKAADAQAMAQYLARERESIQRELRLEVESRFHLASEIAHRLNNPLNYISTASVYIKGQIEDIRREIMPLFQGSADRDPQTNELELHFNNRFDQTLAPFQELSLGLTRATESITEIRALSGIDGTNLESISLRKCLKRILLSSKADTETFAPILKSISDLQDISVYVDINNLKPALEMALSLDRDFPLKANQWSISLVKESDSPLVGIVIAWRPHQKISLESCQEQENKANYLLMRSHARIKIHPKFPDFSIEIFLPHNVIDFENPKTIIDQAG